MTSEATYAAVSRSLEISNMRYRSVRFVCQDKDVKDVDIVRALMVQCGVRNREFTPCPVTSGWSWIERALEPYAEVISIKDLCIRDFPEIKNGKQRVVLKPREARLPSFFQVGRYKASLFFTGRVSCCPYFKEADHLGRDCQRKREKKCFKCGRTGHYQRNCPDFYQRYED